jgi:hypothetical protein
MNRASDTPHEERGWAKWRSDTDPARSDRDPAEPNDDRTKTRHDRTETRLSQMTIRRRLDMIGQRPGWAKWRSDRDPTRSDRDQAEPNDDQTEQCSETEQMPKSRSRWKLLRPASRGNQIGEWRSIGDGKSFSHKKEIKATRHSSQRRDPREWENRSCTR